VLPPRGSRPSSKKPSCPRGVGFAMCAEPRQCGRRPPANGQGRLHRQVRECLGARSISDGWRGFRVGCAIE
jgi:hypothetical protein